MFRSTSLTDLIQRELQFDRFDDDVTTRLLGKAAHLPAVGSVLAKERGVFCGGAVVQEFQRLLSPNFSLVECAVDGASIEAGGLALRFRGPFGMCLSLERTLLNFLCHLSGIATKTRHFVDATKSTRIKILATRKTLPGLRECQLEAVRAGGGFIHRRSLADGILIKDNHINCLDEATLLNQAKRMRSPLHRIEIEVQNLAALERVLRHEPDIIMLDNLPVPDLIRALELIDKRCEVEISGGVELEAVPQLAELGADYISVGALTHSVRALDLSLDLVTEK